MRAKESRRVKYERREGFCEASQAERQKEGEERGREGEGEEGRGGGKERWEAEGADLEEQAPHPESTLLQT